MILVNQDVDLIHEMRVRRQGNSQRLRPYPLQIPMYHSLIVYICQPPSDTHELPEAVISDGCDQQLEQNPTSSGRFASLLALINSLMFPFTIHSDAIAK